MRFRFLLAVFALGCSGAEATKPAVELPARPVQVEKLTRSDAEWKKLLTPQQYEVLREKGTERAFTGALLKNEARGVYRCAACGLELFSSADKFDSGTGWPSYTRPVTDGHVESEVDLSHGMRREEVHCARCGGHLGHVFDDGPPPTGKRFCINSVSLVFEPEAGARYVAPADLEAKVKSGALAEAVFAGGCFWCMEGPFEKTEGVVAAISGYAGGPEPEPSYDQVSSGRTGHTESVRVLYDPKRVTYEKLLEIYWRNIDPTQANGQFCDKGPQYRAAVFYGSDAEKAAAERTKAAAEKTLNATVVTEIVPRGPFWAAENYHQDFYETNPTRYRGYREGCGRDRRLKQLWGD